MSLMELSTELALFVYLQGFSLEHLDMQSIQKNDQVSIAQ